MKRLTDVIFDFDGTIVDSAPAILTSLQSVLNKHSLTSKAVLDNRLIGPPLAETISYITGLVAPDDISGLIDDFKYFYDDVGVDATKAYPEVIEQLEVLKEQGLRLHIATNKRISPTMRILSRLGLCKHFDYVYAIDSANPVYSSKSKMINALLKERNIKPESACYIGDRSDDAVSACRNKLMFCLAGWGYGDILHYEKHWVTIESPNQLSKKILIDVNSCLQGMCVDFLDKGYGNETL